jgi:hypothetical protein
MSTPTAPLWIRCKICRGSGEAGPDEGIHELIPDNSDKIKRRRRAAPHVCPNCFGRGFTPTPITDTFVRVLADEHNAAIDVLQELVDLFATSELLDGPSYLSDGTLLAINMKAEGVLDRARAAGRKKPERPALKKG